MSKIMERKNQNRDSCGRFFPAGKMDAEQEAYQKYFETQNKLAKVYIEMCEKIGRPDLVEHFGIKQLPKTDNWHLDNGIPTFFAAFFLGVCFGQKENKDKVSGIVSLYGEILSLLKENSLRWNEIRLAE